MQNPVAAADEAERCVKELECSGININGYSNIGGANDIHYLDEPQCRPFWAKISELDVLVYLHLRYVAPNQTRAFRGYVFLAGSPWGFGRETAEHVLRLMLSGLFDEFPKLKVVLGHCDEGLPFSHAHTDHRLRHFSKEMRSPNKQSLCYYLNTNIWITMASVQRRSTLEDTIREVAAERVMFSIDYPYEDMLEVAEWFDNLEMDPTTKSLLKVN